MSTAKEAVLSAPGSTADQARSWRAPAKSGPRVLRNIFCLDDFERPAQRYIPRPIFGYVKSGAETNSSIRENRAAYDELAFVPKVLVDTTERTQKTTLFGRTYDSPFGFSPMGCVSLAAYQGELVLARAARHSPRAHPFEDLLTCAIAGAQF